MNGAAGQPYAPGALDEADRYLLVERFVQVTSGQEADSAEAAKGRGHLAPQRSAAAVRAAVSAPIPLAPPAQGGLRRAGAEVVGP